MNSIQRAIHIASIVIIGLAAPLNAHSQDNVWAWGNNLDGQLGNGTTTDSSVPVQVPGLSGVVAVAGGCAHCLAVDNTGTVWAWGYNVDGELGNGTPGGFSSMPVQVKGLAGVVKVAGGFFHSLAIKSDGTAWAWGYNAFGQLGNGTSNNSAVPVQITGLSGTATVVGLVGGVGHSLAVKDDGTVWAWGNNGFGQLGNGTTINTTVPLQVQGLSGTAKVIEVATGDDQCLALKDDGTVWAWGRNEYGALGNGTTSGSSVPVQVTGLSGVIAVACGALHSLALKSDGTVWTWGYNDFGQLGNGTTNNSSVPVQVIGLSGVAEVAAGYDHSLAVKTDGTAWAWGENLSGQLGTGTRVSSTLPVRITDLSGTSGVIRLAAGRFHSLAYRRFTGTTAASLTLFPAAGQIGKTTTFSANLNDKKTHIPIEGRGVQFFVDGVSMSEPVSTSVTGHASFRFIVPAGMTVGSHAIDARFAGDTVYAPATGSSTLTISSGVVKVAVSNITTVVGNSVALTAKLMNGSGAPIAGVTLDFSVDGLPEGSTATNVAGVAKLVFAISPYSEPAVHAITAAFSGDANYQGGTGSGVLTVNKSRVKLSAPTVSGHAGSQVVISAILMDYSNTPLVGETLTFAVSGVVIGSATTDAAGTAKLGYSIPAIMTPGYYAIIITFDGDVGHLAGSRTAALVVQK